MLRITQRAFSSKRQLSTLVERQFGGTNSMRLVKNQAHILASTAAIKRQQPWKWMALYYGSKRFYNGNIFDILCFEVCLVKLMPSI
jgi:hypothetical protein